MDRTRHSSRFLRAILALGAILALVGNAQAQPDIRITGNASYSHTATTAILAVDQIDTVSIAQGISIDVRLELWAFPTPYSGIGQVGYEQAGHLLATYDLGPLAYGYYFLNVKSPSVPFTPPPPGKWSMSLFVTEYNGGNHNVYGFLPMDFRNFPAETFPQGAASALSLPSATPQVGLWWNPAESGSGYAIDLKNGTLVVTVFSYKANGDPQWYMASGPLVGASFSASLDKYAAGQCISCAYAGRPAQVGSDGTITINFTSSTSATVTLPGGRVTLIQPQEF